MVGSGVGANGDILLRIAQSIDSLLTGRGGQTKQKSKI